MPYIGWYIAMAAYNLTPAIEVKDVWKSYGDAPVLQGLTITVPRGKVLVILGKSGVGKSVLLRAILGLERPDKGTIEVEGQNINELKQRDLYRFMNQFGMLFQSSALFDSMTIFENISFYLNQHGDPQTKQKLSLNELKNRVSEALRSVGLSGYEDKMPSMLSGGQKRRAALARLIIYKPKIMFYDEPTTGLDPITAMQINELIASTHKQLGATTVIVTHDIRSALEIGDIFALHDEGIIPIMDTKEKFIQSEDLRIKQFFENALIPAQYFKLIEHRGIR